MYRPNCVQFVQYLIKELSQQGLLNASFVKVRKWNILRLIVKYSVWLVAFLRLFVSEHGIEIIYMVLCDLNISVKSLVLKNMGKICTADCFIPGCHRPLFTCVGVNWTLSKGEVPQSPLVSSQLRESIVKRLCLLCAYRKPGWNIWKPFLVFSGHLKYDFG